MWWRMLSMAMLLLLHCTRSAHGAARVSRSDHTNNWAVLVDTSRFWYNYRHASNTLTIYRHVALVPSCSLHLNPSVPPPRKTPVKGFRGSSHHWHAVAVGLCSQSRAIHENFSLTTQARVDQWQDGEAARYPGQQHHHDAGRRHGMQRTQLVPRTGVCLMRRSCALVLQSRSLGHAGLKTLFYPPRTAAAELSF